MSMVDRAVVQVMSMLASLQDRKGQGLAEYGLILALVAVLCVAALTALKGGINNTLNSVANSL